MLQINMLNILHKHYLNIKGHTVTVHLIKFSTATLQIKSNGLKLKVSMDFK